MKLEGDYAVDKGKRAHRIAAAALVLVMAGVLAYLTGRVGDGIRFAVQSVLPAALIWFADEIALCRGGVKSGGWAWRICRASPGRPLRWAGWFLLAMIVVRWVVVSW